MIAFSDAQTSLSLFAEAIAGRPVPFEVVDDYSGCWPDRFAPLVQDDAPSPLRIPPVARTRHTYRSLILHEVLLASVTVPPDLLASRDALLHALYGLVEDHRVHAYTRREFPGGAEHLASELEACVSRSTKTTPGDLLAALWMYSRGVPNDVVAKRCLTVHPELLTNALRLVDHVEAAGSSPQTSLVIAQSLIRLLNAAQLGRANLAELIGELITDEDAPALPSEATTGVSVDSGTPAEIVDSEGAAGGQLMSEHDGKTLGEAVPEEPAWPGLQVPQILGSTPAAAERRTFVYDEWDYHQSTFRPAWCRVIEEELVGDDFAFIGDMLSNCSFVVQRSSYGL